MTIDGVTYGSGTQQGVKLAKNRAGKAPAGGTRPPPGWRRGGPLTHSLGRAHQEAEWESERRRAFVRSGRVGPLPAPPSMHPPTATHSALRCLSLGAICVDSRTAGVLLGVLTCASREAWGCRSSTAGQALRGLLLLAAPPPARQRASWEPASPSRGEALSQPAGVI